MKFRSGQRISPVVEVFNPKCDIVFLLLFLNNKDSLFFWRENSTTKRIIWRARAIQKTPGRLAGKIENSLIFLYSF